MYNQRVIEEFTNPQNVGIVKKANGVGKVTSPVCGDIIKLYLRISNDGIIEDAGFKTFGCAASIASSSIATQLVIGKTVQQALEISHANITDILGGLPDEKMHSAIIAEEAIVAAIEDYYKKLEKQGKQAAETEEDEEE